MSAVASNREILLQTAALDAARSWTQTCCIELAREGRPVEGGWPGTMREARVRAGAQASRVLAAHTMSALTHDELGRLTRLTFDEARRVWRTIPAERTPE